MWLTLRHPDRRLAALWEELESATPTRPIVKHLASSLHDEGDEVCLKVGLRIEAESRYQAGPLARRFVEAAVERYGIASFDRTADSHLLVCVCPPEDEASGPEELAPNPEDFERRLVPAQWHHAIPLDDGRRVRIIARMGPRPPARVDVQARLKSLVITLFERRPPRLSPDGIPYGEFPIAITASFDVVLPNPLEGRRLIDGVTGFDPSTVKPGYGIDAYELGMTGPCVPIGRSFDWRELTGRAWFDPKPSEGEPNWPVADIFFFSSSDGVRNRREP